MIKKILREIYLLPRGEQRALLLLSLLLILSLIARATVQVLPGKPPPGMEEFTREARAIMASIQKLDSLKSPVTPVTGRSPMSPITPHPETPVSRLSPATGRRPMSPIYINTADSVLLLPLPGIGPVFAGRIIRYRKLLGGFVNIKQLNEVYGLKAETIKLISDHIIIDSLEIRKMNLDSISFQEMLRHPYLQMDDVRALVNYRDYKGRIKSLEEIGDNSLLHDSTLKKVGPYLQFGN